MNFNFSQRNKIICYLLIAIGIISIAMSFATGYEQRWANLLQNNFYFMAIALGGTFFLAVQYAANVGWSVAIKRVPEAMGQYLLFAGILMIIIYFTGKHHLYHWTDSALFDKNSPDYDKIIAGKSGYLNEPFFIIRMLLYFIIWIGLTKLIRKESILEDANGGLLHYNKMKKMSVTFIVLFAITVSTSSWDFIMSIETHWFSTMFGWYTFAGIFVSALAMIGIITATLKRNGYMEWVTEHHLHDIGKFMFAFSIFWTYLWFSQFMLIWYANLPEEVTYFMLRQDHYEGIWIGTFFINFICPFLILMTRDAKRKTAVMISGGIIILIGHWLDTFIMVIPGVMKEHGHLGWMEIGTGLGFLGLFLYVIMSELSKVSLLAQNHPHYGETVHHTI